MSGYLTHWRDAEDSPAGRILKQISSAGDRYHSTESWTDDEYGESCADAIERVVGAEVNAAAEREREQCAIEASHWYDGKAAAKAIRARS